MAGNDTEGPCCATIETPETYWLRRVEDTGGFADEPCLVDRHLLQVCSKQRFPELIHDFIAFDAGIRDGLAAGRPRRRGGLTVGGGVRVICARPDGATPCRRFVLPETEKRDIQHNVAKHHEA